MAGVTNEKTEIEFSSPVEEVKYWREKVSLLVSY